jgi:CHAT domain-containing protein
VRDKEALLAYSLLDGRVAIWLLQRGQEPRVFQIRVTRQRVLEAIRAVRTSLEPDSGRSLPVFNRQASGDLYQWLLAEPLKWIPPGTRIIVIPDSELGTIPFEVLTKRGPEGTVEFAGRWYTFSYAPSATVLAHQRRYRSADPPPASHRRLLAAGDPVFDEADPRVRRPAGPGEISFTAAREVALRSYSEKRGLGIFSRLRWTGQEVKQVASALGVPTESPDVRLGVDANEHDVKNLDLLSYRYLHFATHGVLAEDLPYLKQPALVLSQVGDLMGEDGFLTMEEVLNLKFGADLTVLSACQTGLGQEISGEGIVGLMRAFLYAGSQSVLVSLWRVEDESTAVLMVRFYQYVAQGVPQPEALKQAKEALRTEHAGRFAHPYYWAPFVLFGSE